MNLGDFDYNLPEKFIAQKPIESRDNSKLLVLNADTGFIQEVKFFNILDSLTENDVLVLNETKVINARLKGKVQIYQKGIKKIKEIEIFLHKEISIDTWECLGPGNNLKVGKKISFYNKEGDIKLEGTIENISSMGRYIKFNKKGIELLGIIEQLGELPLPPYIKERLNDNERYQTVFSKIEGSVAAPTAGLHFTNELLDKIKAKGVIIEKVLLHVGVGTFKPVEEEDITKHYMHNEYIELKEDTAIRLNKYKNEGKNIIAVGTTSVRVLESFSSNNGILKSGEKETNIFIYPGYKWKFIDSIITNFHLPKSTLLMLISSFAGIDKIKIAYEYAINNNFRFFSFGDAMRIKR